jgi:DNA-3-methyladenine glycosylase II
MNPHYWQDAINYLSRSDRVIADLIASKSDAILKNRSDPFQTLVRAVVGQQISVKAADTIWQRVEQKF